MVTGRRWNQSLAMGLIGLALLAASAAGMPVQADGPNRAGVILVHGNGQTLTHCVAFSESQITGLDLLQRSELDLNIDASNPIGVAVCRIDQEGCTFPTEACFCQCQGSPCVYWSYWHLTAERTWKYSSMGAANSTVRSGDVDGWVWGAGTTSSGSPPPAITFDQICPSATATPSPTVPPPTSTPVPPTLTYTAPPPTFTPVPPTPTYTSRPPTSIPVQIIASATPNTPAPTYTPLPPTSTPVPPTTTAKAMPPTITAPTATPALPVETVAGPATSGATQFTPGQATQNADQVTSVPGPVTIVPSPVEFARVVPSATPRPTRSGPAPTPLLALDQRPTATAQPASPGASPWANVGLIGAIVLVGAAATGLTLLVLKRLK